MAKETFRIKYIENGKTIVNFSMNFRNWRRMHRKGGGSPYVIETTGTDIFNMNRIEITLRDAEKDAIYEEQKAKEEVNR